MKLKYFLAIVALATLVVPAYAIHSQITPKPFTPFVVNSVMSSPLANGKTYTENFSTAVRYDGSWVEIRAVHAGRKNWEERDIHDFNSATLTVVEDMTKSTVTTVILPHDITEWRLVNTGSCEGKSSGQILSHDVTYTEETYQITDNPQGQATAVVKRWLAPDLACFVLQKETVWTRNSDGVLLAHTTITPLSVTLEPTDQFFEIPTDYHERTPGEVLRMQAALYPNDIPMPADTSGIDASYDAAHAKPK
jgi:hypothetical protein